MISNDIKNLESVVILSNWTFISMNPSVEYLIANSATDCKAYLNLGTSPATISGSESWDLNLKVALPLRQLTESVSNEYII